MTAGQKVAEQAAQVGAYSHLDRPFDLEHLVVAVQRGLTGGLTQRTDVHIDDLRPLTVLESSRPAT